MAIRKKFVSNFYFWVYLFAFVFAILGLVVNNNTMTLNKKIQDISHKKKLLEDANEALYLRVLSDLPLDQIDYNAAILGMRTPEHITLILASPHAK